MSDPSSHQATPGARAPIPPPLPEAALESPSKPIAPLLRIPGMVEDGEARRLSVGDKQYSVADIVALTRKSNEKSQIAALKILGALEGLSRSELHLAASALYVMSFERTSIQDLARESLHKLLLANCTSLEALHLAAQIVKILGPFPEYTSLLSPLVTLLTNTLKMIRFEPTTDRKQCVERRHVLLKALEVGELRSSACESLRAILSDKNEQFATDRKELAGNVLAYFRLNPASSPVVNEVKRLASAALTPGLTTAQVCTSKPVDIDRSTICTTALEAELRRQYGLACALEISKALKLLGRSMRIEEYEKALTFSVATTQSEPTNRCWFSKDEWNTTARLLKLAQADTAIAPEHLAALLYILATRVKAEDHSDPRDSRRRSDTAGADERKRVLREVQRICDLNALDMATITSRAEQIALRALPAPFDTWRFEQHIEPKKNEQNSTSTSRPDRPLRTGQVIAKLLRDDNPSTVTRLVPEELHVLRQVQNLTVEEFKIITERLRARAASDPWARTTILDLVRLPHAPEVTAKVRTAALGALISEARRLGKLHPELEKEVFAVSAEIPYLPFLPPDLEEDQEFLLDEHDEEF